MDDDEYEKIRVAFDEHFIKGATFQEPSASERARAARCPLPPPSRRARRRELRRQRAQRHRTGIRRRLHAARPWALFAALVAVVAVVQLLEAAPTAPQPWVSGTPVMFAQVQSFPTPQRAESRTPLGAPLPVEDRGSYRFMTMQPDDETPVTYDPCRPVRYVVNPRTAPPGAEALLDDAILTISEVTGLRFDDEGLTDERPVSDRSPFQPDRYGDRWAPVLIAWSDPLELPELTGSIAGRGGSVPVTFAARDPAVFVSGIVALDGLQLGQMLEHPDGVAHVRGVLLHELGHLVGLDHVEDPSQLMYAFGGQTQFGSGDLAGLSRLGTGPCFTRL